MLSADAFCASMWVYVFVPAGGWEFEHAARILKIESSPAPCLFGPRELTERKKRREQLCLEASGESLPHRGGAPGNRKSTADIPEPVSSGSQNNVSLL